MEQLQNALLRCPNRTQKTSDLTIDDGLNHTEIVNMVSEGVQVALEDHDNNK